MRNHCVGATVAVYAVRVNPAGEQDEQDFSAQVDAAMWAARVFVAVIAESLEEVESTLTPPQLRALVIIATRGPVNLTTVAEALGVHPSNATRLCERLVQAGFVARTQSAHDRRHLQLEPTRGGARLVNSVMERRRRALERVLAGMSVEERQQLASAFHVFAGAAGEVTDDGTWPAWNGRRAG